MGKYLQHMSKYGMLTAGIYGATEGDFHIKLAYFANKTLEEIVKAPSSAQDLMGVASYAIYPLAVYGGMQLADKIFRDRTLTIQRRNNAQ